MRELLDYSLGEPSPHQLASQVFKFRSSDKKHAIQSGHHSDETSLENRTLPVRFCLLAHVPGGRQNQALMRTSTIGGALITVATVGRWLVDLLHGLGRPVAFRWDQGDGCERCGRRKDELLRLLTDGRAVSPSLARRNYLFDVFHGDLVGSVFKSARRHDEKSCWRPEAHTHQSN